MKFGRMSHPTRGWEETTCGFCRFSCKIRLQYGPCRDVKKNGQKKPAWPRGNLIFAVIYIYIFYIYTFCCLPQPTALDLFRVN